MKIRLKRGSKKGLIMLYHLHIGKARPSHGNLYFCQGSRFILKVAACWTVMLEANLGPCTASLFYFVMQ